MCHLAITCPDVGLFCRGQGTRGKSNRPLNSILYLQEDRTALAEVLMVTRVGLDGSKCARTGSMVSWAFKVWTASKQADVQDQGFSFFRSWWNRQ